jgi:hypothetical protein
LSSPARRVPLAPVARNGKNKSAFFRRIEFKERVVANLVVF